MLKRYELSILLKVFLMLVVLCLFAWLVVNEYYIYLMIVVPVVLYQIGDFFRFHKKAQEEVSQFVESVHYRDFSRFFDEKHAPQELRSLRKGFNEINSTFKVISKEKETQYQYLQKILELVDTGIISYEMDNGTVVWMNEAFKKILGIPYLKTIHSLEKKDNILYQRILALSNGESQVLTIGRDHNHFKILLSATAFQTDGKKYKLIAFKNVNEALEETESNAWQRLLSVMTHEIMNSVAPISSLADTLKNMLEHSMQEFEGHAQAGMLEDIELGVNTIKRRSEGLLKFAETYRSLNKITSLNLKKVFVKDLFGNLRHLMQPTLAQKEIQLELVLKDPGMMLQIDIHLVEQVLINLLVNAMEAVRGRENPRIVLSAAATSDNRTMIKVADNGVGMPAELLDKIFIPFFSTRKNGSGIGLSLCKQIMMLHKGNIQVQSTENEGTAFYLLF